MIHYARPILVFLLAAVAAHAAVTPSDLNRKRYSNTVTITATGTAATLDGNPFPLSTATPVTAIGFHDLLVTDGGTTTSYKFIVRNSERGSTEDGIPTMRPYRYVLDAPSAFSDAVLNVLAPAVYPKNLPIPVMARLTKGPSFGASAGGPLFLNGLVQSSKYPGNPILLRRGWGSTILSAATAAGPAAYDASVNGRTASVQTVIEDTTTWVTKTGAVSGSENWGANARIQVTGTISVPAGASLTIGAGTIVRCSPGVEFWVRPGGSVQINGTVAAPVVFVPDSTSSLWGGFWLQPASGANVATLTATGTIFCCWGANQSWYTAPAGEPARSFPHHRNQQPCVATAPGGVCTLTDCALIGPTGFNQTRGAALATNGGSLILTRVLMQRCITGGEQEDCPTFTFDTVALLEMTEPGLDVDGDGFADADNDGIYLVPDGNTYTLDHCVIGWTKDDGIDTGGDGAGTVTCRNCWFENCIHEAMSNSGVNRIPQSIDGVHFNSGQGIECGYGGPHSLLQRTLVTGCMVGARYGDNYGSNSGNNGTGTSQYDGDVTVRDSFSLYNLFHDTWAIDFSRFDYQNQRFTLINSKVTKAADLAAQNGSEDSGNSLWNPATDAGLIAGYMPVPGSDVGVDFPVVRRQDTYAAWPAAFTVRLSTFSSKEVSISWRVAGKTAPEADAETPISTGTLTWQPGETLKTFSVPAPTGYGVVSVRLLTPVNAAVTGSQLLYFPPSGPPPPEQVLIAKNAAGWSYHSALTPNGWTNATPWPSLDAASRAWTHPLFTESTSGASSWYQNKTVPIGWGNIGATGSLQTLATLITERPVTAYFRKTFTVTAPDAIQSLKLELQADDGASVYINGTRVSPTSWGLDPGTNVGGSLYYNQLSSRFNDGANERNFDTLILSGATMPALNPAPALNVLAIEVHQNSVDSSDCVFDAALTETFFSPVPGIAGFGKSAAGAYVYWTDPTWVLETNSTLDPATWISRPDLQSPVPIVTNANRALYRLRQP